MKKVLIIIGISLLVFVGVVILLNRVSGTSNTKKINDYVNSQGYKTTEDSLFYQKIVTNNTLDDYYDDVSNNKNSEYNEYYFSKDSYSFIELRMIYKDEINQLFNVTSDFRNNKITYNYEISKNKASIILEGSYLDGSLSCNTSKVNNITTTNIDSYCELAKKYMNEFINEQNKLLSNDEFREAISQVNGVVIDD